MANAFQGKKVLITGGLGFIGSNLALRLVDMGARVTLVDSLIPEYGGNPFNINGIENKVQVNISDVRDEHSMNRLVKNQDYLFNLAGQTSHYDSMQDPVTDLEINAKAQLFILEACRKYNPGIKIIFAGTRQIYGKPQYLPVDEKHPINPIDINGINKFAGEWYHLIYNQVHGIKTSILRLTNTIGPRMRIKDARQTFIGVWIRLLLEGKPLEVWGGEQLRDFTYIDDAVAAFLIAAVNDKANGQIFNLGANSIISLKYFAALLFEINGSGKYIIVEYPAERKVIEIGNYQADYRLINSALGWKPEVHLRDALKNTLNYYRENLHKYI